ncbi:MAG: hypothetical protein FJX75_08535 [Armatimonadetes bacterium]|nr:hypothetical protein [Armatimonadota bacterium]
MNCDQARDLIERQPDEPFSAADAEGLARHLATCSACSRLAEETATLLQELRELECPEGDDATWDMRVRQALPEGVIRLRARRDRRAVHRLAWATAAVWVLAWVVGRGVHAPSMDAPPPAPAEAAVDAADLYEGLPIRATAPSAALPPEPRRVAIERLLSAEEPDAEPLPAEAAPAPPERGSRAEVSSRV